MKETLKIPYNSHESQDSEENDGGDHISGDHEGSEVREHSHGVEPIQEARKERIITRRYNKLYEDFKKKNRVKDELLQQPRIFPHSLVVVTPLKNK